MSTYRSPSNPSVEIKCRICDTWYDAPKHRIAKCPHCGFPAHERIKQDPPLVESENPFSLDLSKSLLPAKPTDALWLTIIKKIINFFFLVYLFIMALISWMAVTFSG